MRAFLSYILLFSFFAGRSQNNLIINPGFEFPPSEQKMQDIGAFELNTPVEMTPDKNYTAGYQLATGWYMPTDGTSDYLQGNDATAFGWPIMSARTGTGRGGLILGGKSNLKREYLQVALKEPLKRNRKYCLKFYVAHEKASNYASNQISAYFTHDLIRSHSKKALKITPHINLTTDRPITHHQGWVEVCGTYVAYGGEKYITIGNFNTETEPTHIKDIYEDYKAYGGKQGFMHPFKKQAYYYVDDVSLLESADTNICQQWISETSDTIRNWVFLIDASGSMSSVDKFTAIKREVLQIAPALPTGSQLSLITFRDGSNSVKYNIPSSDYKAIEQFFSSVAPNGGSGVGEGMRLAISNATSNNALKGKSEIFVFTDGVISGHNDANFLIEKMKSAYPKILLHTIQFGSSHQGEKVLKKLAQTGGGHYYPAGKIDLREIFHDHIGLKLIKNDDCYSFSECCKPPLFIDEYSFNNTTFLLDVSGSMKQKDKLPLLKETLVNLSDSMRQKDILSIVQFSGMAEVVLSSTSYQDRQKIDSTINRLKSKGQTNLEKGITTAVDAAIVNYLPGHNNTMLLATDGKAEFTRKIKQEIKRAAQNDIRVSVLHFSDFEGEKLKRIAELGNGSYHLISNQNLWEEFATEIKRKRMGEAFYTYGSDYSNKKKGQINSYRWSRAMIFISPIAAAVWQYLNNQ